MLVKKEKEGTCKDDTKVLVSKIKDTLKIVEEILCCTNVNNVVAIDLSHLPSMATLFLDLSKKNLRI